jgi:hypothetical protein
MPTHEVILREELSIALEKSKQRQERIAALEAELADANFKTEAPVQKPVAVVRILETGGNPGIAWRGAPLEDAPMMRGGEHLYLAPPADDEAVELLKEAQFTLSHARIFISSREKMHPTGKELYAKLEADIAAYLKEGS